MKPIGDQNICTKKNPQILQWKQCSACPHLTFKKMLNYLLWWWSVLRLIFSLLPFLSRYPCCWNNSLRNTINTCVSFSSVSAMCDMWTGQMCLSRRQSHPAHFKLHTCSRWAARRVFHKASYWSCWCLVSRTIGLLLWQNSKIFLWDDGERQDPN